MKLIEMMERVGSREPEKVRAYIDDALQEIQEYIPDKTTGYKIDIVSGQRLYALPSNMIKLLGVYQKYDSQGRYIRIGRIENLDLMEDLATTAAAATTSISAIDSIVVV